MSIVLAVARGPEGAQVEWRHSIHSSLSEAARDEPPHGVYLVARTYRGGHVLELDAHFDRMERSAAAQGWPLRVPRTQLRQILRQMLHKLGGETPRGPTPAEPPPSGPTSREPTPQGPTLHKDTPSPRDGRFRVTAVLDDPPWYRLAMEPAGGVNPELLRLGVHCSVHRGAVRADAEIKSTAWMAERRSLAAQSRGRADPVYEHLLAREDGAILEGASSNFYACIGGTVHTAGEGVLHGIARRIVLTVIDDLAPEVTVDFQPATIAQLESGAIDEAFITSSTRGVVPVRSIDTVHLGPPGALTAEISRRYAAWLAAHLEPL
ncbi:MAG: aminotransferase class IV [Alkalispirochaeta sp.]